MKKVHCLKFEGNKKTQKKKISKKKLVATEITTNKIVWINGPWRGRRHDAFIFNEGGIVSKLQATEFVIADKGYIGCRQAITPLRGNYRNASVRDRQINKRFSKIRIPIEHTFGKMKIFRVLKGPWRGNAHDLLKIFYVISYIHNLLFC